MSLILINKQFFVKNLFENVVMNKEIEFFFL
jgi:hypothetical protein